MNKKTIYEQPTAELFVVRFEKGFLEISGGANYSDTPGGAGGGDSYDDGDGF